MCYSGAVVKLTECDVLLGSRIGPLHISGPTPRLVTEATARMGSVLSLQSSICDQVTLTSTHQGPAFIGAMFLSKQEQMAMGQISYL